MAAVVIDGNAIAEQLRQSIADELQVLRLSEVRPGLATVLIGESFDAQAYEKHVKRLAESLDYRYVCERLPEDIELADVIATLGKLNADPRITGILVLHPLPPQIPEAEMNSAVDPLQGHRGGASDERGAARAGPAAVPALDAGLVLLPARPLRGHARRRARELLLGPDARRGRAFEQRRQAGADARAAAQRDRDRLPQPDQAARGATRARPTS